MPPAKVKVEMIETPRKKQACFHKRRCGLIKKAVELSIMTGSDVVLMIKPKNGHAVCYSNLGSDAAQVEKVAAECISHPKTKFVSNNCYNSVDIHGRRQQKGSCRSEGEEEERAGVELEQQVSNSELEKVQEPQEDEEEDVEHEKFMDIVSILVNADAASIDGELVEGEEKYPPIELMIGSSRSTR